MFYVWNVFNDLQRHGTKREYVLPFSLLWIEYPNNSLNVLNNRPFVNLLTYSVSVTKSLYYSWNQILSHQKSNEIRYPWTKLNLRCVYRFIILSTLISTKVTCLLLPKLLVREVERFGRVHWGICCNSLVFYYLVSNFVITREGFDGIE